MFKISFYFVVIYEEQHGESVLNITNDMMNPLNLPQRQQYNRGLTLNVASDRYGNLPQFSTGDINVPNEPYFLRSEVVFVYILLSNLL